MEIKLKINQGHVNVYRDGKQFSVIGGGNASNAYVEDDKIIVEKNNGTWSAYDFNLKYLGGGGGAAKPAGSSKSHKTKGNSKTNTEENAVARFLAILAAAVLLALSPGILVYDLLSDVPRNLGGKWWQVTLISMLILGISLTIKKNDLSKGFIIYGILCALSSTALLIWWYFFDGMPLSGYVGRWF